MPQPSTLGKHSLAECVDVSVGRLPQTQDGLGVGDAHQADVVRAGRRQAGGSG